MSGHSKWSTIKRKKAATDAKRGKIFTRYLKEIQIAAKVGGGNPDANPRLRTAILGAKAQSVPNDNIERAIQRGTGELDGVDYEDFMYEGYGPGGAAILVKGVTDNKNRCASEVRHAFTKCGGNLAGSNAVAYLFKEKGTINVSKSGLSEDKVFETALEAGALDINDEGDTWEVLTTPQDFEGVKAALEKLGGSLEGEVRLVPDTYARVTGHQAESLVRLLEMLDDLDDVQTVVSNFDMDESEMEALNKNSSDV